MKFQSKISGKCGENSKNDAISENIIIFTLFSPFFIKKPEKNQQKFLYCPKPQLHAPSLQESHDPAREQIHSL